MKRAFTLVFLLLVSLLPSFAADKTDKNSANLDPKQENTFKDINAIGNRNVGCGRGIGNWYSVDKQVQMGRQYSQQVEQQAKMITDPVITEYINRVGQNLVRNSDSQVPFTIKVIDTDEVNAFALPGGFFYVNSGLILAADNEAELAGVMAHEIAHVAACHAAREQTRGNLANLATLPLIFVPMGLGAYYGIQGASSLLVPATFMKFSRNFEAEADYLGTEYLYKSGYDPRGMTDMFEKLEALEKKKPGFLGKAFESHPPTPDRVEKTQQEIATILPAKDQYVLDTSEFENVKARLAALENKRKLQDPNDKDRPQLRRANSPDAPSTTNGKSGGDDNAPPVLKRKQDQ